MRNSEGTAQHTGAALGNPVVLTTQGRFTLLDGPLAAAALAGLGLNAGLGWWWPTPSPGTCCWSTPPRGPRDLLREARTCGGQILLGVAGGLLLGLVLLIVLWRTRPDTARLRDGLRLLPDLIRLLRRLAPTSSCRRRL